MASRDGPRWWTALVLAPGLLAASLARASDTVVLLRTPDDRGPWRAAEGRTRDELRLMGLRVEEVRGLPRDAAHILDEQGARAVIRIGRADDGGSAEIWTVDPQGAPQRLELAGLPFAGNEAAALAGLRAAEAVHGLIGGDAELGTTEIVGSRGSVNVATSAGRGGAVNVTSAGRDGTVNVTSARRDGAVNVTSAGRDAAANVTSAGRDAAVNVGIAAPPIEAPSPPSVAVVPWPEPSLAVSPSLEGPATVPVESRSMSLDEVLDVAPRRPVRTPQRPPGRVRGLAIQLAGLGGPGGVGGLVELALALGLRVTPRLTLAPAVSGAVTPVALSAQAGAIRVGAVTGQGMLGYAPGRLDARVSPRLGVGGGLALAWAYGRASSPLRGGADVTPLAVISGAAGLAIRVRARLRLYVGAGLSVLVPAVAVRVSGDEVARWGPLLIRGVVGLEWDWPREE